jgi:hypothetical protein
MFYELYVLIMKNITKFPNRVQSFGSDLVHIVSRFFWGSFAWDCSSGVLLCGGILCIPLVIFCFFQGCSHLLFSAYFYAAY